MIRDWLRVLYLVPFLVAALPLLAAAQTTLVRTDFKIKYVADGAVYLDGGQNDGLAKGMKFRVKRASPGAPANFVFLAELLVDSVASTSAVCEIVSSSGPIRVGDTAVLESPAVKAIQVEKAETEAHSYAQVVTFTNGDPLDEEERAEVPRPPSPEIDRMRGRVGIEYDSIFAQPGSPASQEAGLVIRADMSRIGGTYWYFEGYWRGQLSAQPAGVQQQTLTDLLNRTYQLSLTYDNPHSRFIAGFGRLYLPGATSLGTIDGGYTGGRLSKSVTLGVFGGSTPDPTAWNYNPGREIGGTFLNLDFGNYDSVHFASTTGIAVSDIHWKPDRQFAFFENSFFYKHAFAIYDAAQADLVRSATPSTSPPASKSISLTQSYVTVQLLPYSRISFNVNDTYFRNTPTFAPQLISTGLVQNYLFQGLSGGFRVKLPWGFGIYTDVGKSSRTGDSRSSWNQLYGLTFGSLSATGIFLDMRYAKFDSAYGSGSYESLSFSKQFKRGFHLELDAGGQNLNSALTQQTRAWWVTNNTDWFIGRHYFMGSGFTYYRGDVQRYDQVFLISGYRF